MPAVIVTISIGHTILCISVSNFRLISFLVLLLIRSDDKLVKGLLTRYGKMKLKWLLTF